ncbi:acyl-CoA dehydrogenase family protein [Pyruvatibacter sp.]|uniref:acyl-CoA dehydrogenase family protein n=1 Tax=Pyruvatibacter sp. TaxID=1981328 RepID=UPI0032ED0F85
MDMSFSADLDPFRNEVRSFFANDYPQDILEKVRAGHSLTTPEVRRAEMALGAKGWLASAWPREFGGPGWSIEEQYIFDEELERAGAPTVTPMGVIYVGPVIFNFGSDAQKEKWLGPTRRGEMGWAQGYSEPGSGSDLASLQFSAKREGDEFVLNGTKIWTSAAQHADWIFLLARTSKGERKQQGISFVCCEMDRDGVTLVPIIGIDGKHYLNQVIFEDVRVPVDYMIGEEGKGWEYSTYLLGNERTSYARIGAKRKMLSDLKDIARAAPMGGNAALYDDEVFRHKVADTEMRVDGLETTVLRILSSVAEGGSPGNEASTVKILATETHQRITELMVEACGRAAQIGSPDCSSPEWATDALTSYAPPSVSAYFAGRAQSIYGGTNEIQKNIIAKRVLGL